MKVALLRVGIDAGSGGMQGPLFEDGSFDFVPIPDGFGIDTRTYGNTLGRRGNLLLDYFPKSRHARMALQSMHYDPEFTTFTYGDPTSPKAGLRHLKEGDILAFYAGLQGWGFNSPPGLYLIGFFEVAEAGLATEFSDHSLFAENFHVRHQAVFEKQKPRLVLVRGGVGSRLLKKAVLISCVGKNISGKPLKVLSPAMQKIFGDFDGRIAIERSPTRWVKPEFIESAAGFVRSLE